VMPALSVYNEN